MHGGTVYYEEEYPELLFTKDGEGLDYGKWYCVHYHTEKKIDRLEIMFENFDWLCGN